MFKVSRALFLGAAISAGFVLSNLGPQLASAQGITTGGLTGEVVDQASAVLPRTSITAVNTATGARVAQTSREDGGFSLFNLPAGTYTVTFSSPGFAEAVLKDVVVNVGTRDLGKVTLKPSSVQTTVEVTTANPIIDINEAQVSTTFEPADLQPASQQRIRRRHPVSNPAWSRPTTTTSPITAAPPSPPTASAAAPTTSKSTGSRTTTTPLPDRRSSSATRMPSPAYRSSPTVQRAVRAQHGNGGQLHDEDRNQPASTEPAFELYEATGARPSCRDRRIPLSVIALREDRPRRVASSPPSPASRTTTSAALWGCPSRRTSCGCSAASSRRKYHQGEGTYTSGRPTVPHA